jgi:hypothetical protein
MSKSDTENIKEHIEVAIGRARDGVSDRIDEIDRRLRTSLDVKQIAADHAPQLLAAGAAVGLLVGLGAPRVITRALQLAIPLAIAVKIVKDRRASHAPAELPGE